MTICHFQGGDVDLSSFLPQAGDDEERQTIDGAISLGDRFDQLCEVIWERGGRRVSRGRRAVMVPRLGIHVLVPLEQLSPLEFASLAYPASGVTGRRRRTG
jgi:hypothetical protein